MLVVFASQRQKCAESCARDDVAPTNCCILNCCLQKLKIMTENPQDGINPEFMARSYLLSVYNDTIWTYPIMSSVAICYGKYALDKKELENEENMGCDGLVPKYFYDVVDCAYNMNLWVEFLSIYDYLMNFKFILVSAVRIGTLTMTQSATSLDNLSSTASLEIQRTSSRLSI